MMSRALFIAVISLIVGALVQCEPTGELAHVVNGLYARSSKDRHQPMPVLQCGLKVNVSSTVTIYWSSNGRHAEEDKHYVISNSDYPPTSTLNFTKIGEADIGVWLCTIVTADRNITVNVTLFSFPQIKPLPKSVNLVEGETLNLECHVWGWPLPTVSWLRGGQPINASDSRVSYPNDTDVPNMKLKIVDTTPDDRDDYVCVAISKINETVYEETLSTLVRVKSRLAPLWPFLGILAEVLVLGVIIVFYECYRRKQNSDTDDKDASQNQHAVPSDEKNKDLRRRK